MKKLVVGISGASGIPLAVRLLKELKKQPEVETHLVMTRGAEMTLHQETPYSLKEICDMADVVYNNHNLGASIASGTFQNDGMIVIPCSMKTIAGIAHGYSDNLLLRACDVMIKEKRKLILVARESPLSTIHLDNLSYLSKLSGVVIMPPMLTYYQLPQSIDDLEIHIVGKILSQFGIELEGFKRWK
ncbi:UbiX family flavin prenyltransferase [Amedibacterium intestinale]|uniref:UbiX family flavin prenyltransferase n=1 Tax=Amedibacterium intestinale TaxID=2583452 RepID=UPI000E204871